PVVVRRDLGGRRARIDVAHRERATRLRAPAPQAAVALARAGRRLRAADFNPVAVAADLHRCAHLLGLRDALTQLRIRVATPAIKAPRCADAAAVSLAGGDERPVVRAAELDRRQLIVARVLIAEPELALEVVSPAPDAGVRQQRAGELERGAHVD